MILAAGGTAFIHDENRFNSFDYLIYFAFNVVIYVLIMFAIHYMRCTIRRTKFAQPKEKLIVIHSVNFSIYLALYATRIAFVYTIENLEKNSDHSDLDMVKYQKMKFVTFIEIITESSFFGYMFLFLLYQTSMALSFF